MQFVSMEVNRHGSSDQLQLGRLSPGLNAICGPNGSGKTTLHHWLRQMAVDNSSTSDWSVRSAPIHAPQYGKVELRNGPSNYRISQTVAGHITCEVASEFNRVGYLASTSTALSAEQQRAFAELTSIDHGLDNVSRMEKLAQQLGLDQPVANPIASERQALLARQADINSRLRGLEGLRSTREGLLSRRGQLEAELHRAQRESQAYRGYGVLGDRERMEDHRSALATELRDVRAELAVFDRDIAGHRSGYALRRSHHELDIGSTYREQLEQLDARLDRWRQTLRDLRAHRERLEHNATDARLDKQIGDQLSITKTADPRGALRSLEAQLLAASQQIDALVTRNDRSYESYQAQASLPESLRNMQRDLYEVCQQLARQESTTAAETLRQQATQLARSESELLQSVEKLIDERAALLRKIADEYHLSMDQLTLAFGDWCECHDHPHLSQWLLNEAPGAHSHNAPEQSAREFYGDELRLWETRRGALQNRIAELQSQLKELESQLALRRQPDATKSLRSEAEVARDLDKVIADLHDLEERDRLRVELDEIRRARAKLPVEVLGSDRYRQLVNKHLDGLTGQRNPENRLGNKTNNGNVHSHTAVYLNGHASHTNGCNLAPTAFAELAARLAIAEAMLERGQPISLLVDGPLDNLTIEQQRVAVRHLEAVAASGQQVILFSGDERVAELVRSAGGWVGYMHERTAVRAVPKAVYSVPKAAYDVNRQLLAVANDHEAEKWFEPVVPRQRLVRRASAYQQLTEASLIEECPSLDATTAARLRALGVDRVGDLLNTDPRWLAEHLRLTTVTEDAVVRWQAEAKLLCSVQQLRPFDARVLAGAGIRHPRQLAEMHPSQLLDRVERFLATDRGREILRSGNSYELSRITSWIASAKSGEGRGRSFVPTNIRPAYNYDTDYATVADDDRDHWQSEPRYARPAREYNAEAEGNRVRNFDRSEPTYPVVNREYEPRVQREPRTRDDLDSSRKDRQPRENLERESRRPRPAVANVARATMPNIKNGRPNTVAAARFYLDLSSPVVDAPSIGPRMAEKLEQIGIYTVEDLLAGNADAIAGRLETKRIDALTIRSWQDQARLVCRIPNLRGHDAQLLVACKVTTPEELSKLNAASLLGQVTAVAKSAEGQRMLRGSQAPDLAEVTDWINWSSYSRSLNAA